MGNDLISIVLVDGQIAGAWKRTLRKDTGLIKLSLFRRLDDGETSAVPLAARHYGDFLGLPVALVQG